MEENKFDDITEEEVSGQGASDGETVNEPEDAGKESSAGDTAREASGGAAVQGMTRARRIAAEVYSWFDTFFFPIVIVMVVFTFFIRMSRVDGTSMLPTLEDGQQLMISNFLYQPQYNDIVVVWAEKLPDDDNNKLGKAIVKRVIGLPGDELEMDFAAGTIKRNGVQLEIVEKDGKLYEDGHIINERTYDSEFSDGHFKVPEGCIFVMGDNRNGSTDSRFARYIGYIDERDIIGKALFRIWPINRIGGIYG